MKATAMLERARECVERDGAGGRIGAPEEWALGG